MTSSLHTDRSTGGGPGGSTLLITCGALARDVLHLIDANGWTHFTIECLPALLHNTPEKIPERVRRKIKDRREAFDRILVLYSDCGTGGRLQQVLDEEGIEGIGGAHCYEMFAGSERFATLMDEEVGSFFLTDFLVRHFDAIVWRSLGLDRYPELLESYFRNYRRLVYLGQTDDPALDRTAKTIAQRLGLAYERRPTGWGRYATFLRDGTVRPGVDSTSSNVAKTVHPKKAVQVSGQ